MSGKRAKQQRKAASGEAPVTNLGEKIDSVLAEGRPVVVLDREPEGLVLTTLMPRGLALELGWCEGHGEQEEIFCGQSAPCENFEAVTDVIVDMFERLGGKTPMIANSVGEQAINDSMASLSKILHEQETLDLLMMRAIRRNPNAIPLHYNAEWVLPGHALSTMTTSVTM